MTAAQLAEDPELLAEIQSAVDEANKAVSQAEAIRKFRVLTEDWTEEGGQMTPSLKLKRSVVMKQYTHTVEELYSAADR
jgi:long-chain acyl-CoA synthetase